MTNPATEAARAFHAVAIAEFQARGEPATARRVSQVLEVSESQYASTRAGRDGYGSLETVYGWTLRWAAAGYPAVCIVLHPSGVEVYPIG